ncbi:hypothetical protein MRB53_037692 [Persea americana]|nr:hypothetical protein MRB53_037692 [Persea americana]
MLQSKPGSSLGSLQHELRDCVESGIEYDSILAAGLNHIWSLHRHTILKSFGITIHGAIDTYSKLVIWMDVCLSHRSDDFARRSRGEEELYDEQVVFRQNRPLENYWPQQTRIPLSQWLEHCEMMDNYGWYYHKSIIDRIAFLAVYMPILRYMMRDYAALHNTHRVSKQKDKPSYVPYDRFTSPERSDAEYRGLEISSAALKPWKDRLAAFDETELLPKRTRERCEQCLAANGINDLPESALVYMPRYDEKKHERAYSCLRDALYVYMIRIDELKLEDLYEHNESSESLATATPVTEEDKDASVWVKRFAQQRAMWESHKQPFVMSRAEE